MRPLLAHPARGVIRTLRLVTVPISQNRGTVFNMRSPLLVVFVRLQARVLTQDRVIFNFAVSAMPALASEY